LTVIAFRLVLVLTILAVLVALAAYFVTGERRWVRWALRGASVGGAILLLYLLLFLLERLVAL